MKNLRFIIILVMVLGGFVALYVFTSSQGSTEPRPGTAQSDEGREHVSTGKIVSYKNTVPTSGTHSVQPAAWGVSPTELPDEAIVHNMEHGGVVVSYRPDADKATVEKLTALLSKPFSNKNFLPTKVILMPRSGQESPILLASWRRTQELDKYDEQQIITYYTNNIGKSPEPRAS
ncbi:MAG: DUF3105 domain-containing protein [Candidatus Nomurabacteria bacterium]|nr:MAG: DUF3105 domain-containing protein [Candidatus Nomurabacteria bacterium]